VGHDLRRHGGGTLAAVAVVTAVLLGAAGCGGGSSDSSGASGAKEKLVIAAGGVTNSNAAIYIARLAGFYDAEGLDVEIKQAGGNASTLVVSGQADLGQLGIATALTPIKDGKQTAVVFGTSAGPLAFVVGNPKITDVKQCKRVTTTFVGSGPYSEVPVYQKAFNVTWDVVPLTDTPSVPNLVISGQADCAVASYSVLGKAIDGNQVRILVDPREQAGKIPSYVEVAIYGLKDKLPGKRAAVEKLLRALVKAYQLIAEKSPADLATMLRQDRDFQAISQEQLVKQIEVEKPIAMKAPNSGYIAASTWPGNLAFLRDGGSTFIDPQEDKWSYANAVDMSYYEAANGKPAQQ
jgi:ABC-type nitrate/sulfonate/bicarbonate transport system substrate-binding protein